MRTVLKGVGAALVAALAAAFVGCGTPGAPQPPSLNLPDRVTDLSALRTGNQVKLSWTMPKRNTDKIPLRGNIDVSVCRREGAGACQAAGELRLPPAAAGSFSETIPSFLLAGPPRLLSYSVELKNARGRSAGPSDTATVVAGAAPAPVSGLAAEVQKAGIVLRWNPDDPRADVRLRRTLLSPRRAKAPAGPLPAPSEPVEQNLVIASAQSAAGRAVDTHISFGESYEYRAQRVFRVPVEGETVELDGELSPPIRVEALDVFPPEVPTGLVAVAVASDTASGTEASIDISWQPNTEADLAGFNVYRREEAAPWERISGDQPVVGPAFHDAHVLPGHTYRYAVSAVDRGGHESARSAEAGDTVPAQ